MKPLYGAVYTTIFTCFAKQKGKTRFKMQLLFYNKVVFTRKYVSS